MARRDATCARRIGCRGSKRSSPTSRRAPPVGRVVALVLLGLAVLAAIVFGDLQAAAPRAGRRRRADRGAGGRLQGQARRARRAEGQGRGRRRDRDQRGQGGQRRDRPEGGARGAGRRPPRAQPRPTPTRRRRAATRWRRCPHRAASWSPPRRSPPARADGAGAAGGGSLVQLGAFPTEAAANAAWTASPSASPISRRSASRCSRSRPAGSTLYRLRVNAGSANQAADICGRLQGRGRELLRRELRSCARRGSGARR